MENKFKILKDILDFKFTLPPNIYSVIYETLLIILVHKIDITKDFLLLKLMELLLILSKNSDFPKLLNKLEEPLFDYIKWTLTLVKTFNEKCTHEV